MNPYGSSPLAAPRGRGGLLAGALAGFLVATGCGISPPEREQARALVESDDGDADVQVVTSTDFGVIGGSQDPTNPQGASVQLVTSDTTVQALPFERTFDIRGTGRVFVRAQTPTAATDTPSVTVSIRVFVDGEQRNAVQGDLADGPVQTVFLSGN